MSSDPIMSTSKPYLHHQKMANVIHVVLRRQTFEDSIFEI